MTIEQPNKWPEVKVLAGGKDFWNWILYHKNYQEVQNPDEPADERINEE